MALIYLALLLPFLVHAFPAASGPAGTPAPTPAPSGAPPPASSTYAIPGTYTTISNPSGCPTMPDMSAHTPLSYLDSNTGTNWTYFAESSGSLTGFIGSTLNYSSMVYYDLSDASQVIGYYPNEGYSIIAGESGFSFFPMDCSYQAQAIIPNFPSYFANGSPASTAPVATPAAGSGSARRRRDAPSFGAFMNQMLRRQSGAGISFAVDYVNQCGGSVPGSAFGGNPNVQVTHSVQGNPIGTDNVNLQLNNGVYYGDVMYPNLVSFHDDCVNVAFPILNFPNSNPIAAQATAGGLGTYFFIFRQIASGLAKLGPAGSALAGAAEAIATPIGALAATYFFYSLFIKAFPNTPGALANGICNAIESYSDSVAAQDPYSGMYMGIGYIEGTNPSGFTATATATETGAGGTPTCSSSSMSSTSMSTSPSQSPTNSNSASNSASNTASNTASNNPSATPNPSSQPSNPAPSNPAPSNPAPSNPASSNPAPSNPAPSNPAPSNPAPSNPAPSKPAPSNPAPQPSNPAPQPSNPAPQPSNPAPQPSNPAPQPSNPAPQPSNPAPQPSSPPVGSSPPPGGSSPPPGGSPPPVGSSPPPVGGSPPPVGGSPPPVGGSPPPVGGSPPPVDGSPPGGSPPPVGGSPPPVGSGGGGGSFGGGGGSAGGGGGSFGGGSFIGGGISKRSHALQRKDKFWMDEIADAILV